MAAYGILQSHSVICHPDEKAWVENDTSKLVARTLHPGKFNLEKFDPAYDWFILTPSVKGFAKQLDEAGFAGRYTILHDASKPRAALRGFFRKIANTVERCRYAAEVADRCEPLKAYGIAPTATWESNTGFLIWYAMRAKDTSERDLWGSYSNEPVGALTGFVDEVKGAIKRAFIAPSTPAEATSH